MFRPQCGAGGRAGELPASHDDLHHGQDGQGELSGQQAGLGASAPRGPAGK